MSNRGTLTGSHRDGGPVPVTIVRAALTTLFASDATFNYYGWAEPGTATSSPKWRVIRLQTGVAAKWAGGTKEFKHVWDNYATLDYP